MKKIIGMYISILLLGTLYAQEKQNPDSTFINSLKPGSWSVQFGISSNFTLTNFNGSSIYFKRHITVHKAWRFGVLFNGRLEDFERDVQGNNPPSYGITNDDYNRLSIDCRAQYLFYPNPDRSINLFFGLGPSVGFSYSDQQETDHSYHLDTLYAVRDEKSEDKIVSIGVSFITGVEYFITKYLSLPAEYSSSLNYQKRWMTTTTVYDYQVTERDDYTTKLKDEATTYNFYFNRVLVGLSAYF